LTIFAHHGASLVAAGKYQQAGTLFCLYFQKGTRGSLESGWTQEQENYVLRLARRYVRLRQSAAIDVEDLVSAARLRWWQYASRVEDEMNDEAIRRHFFVHVKGAMRDAIRDSSPVKVTRSMRSKLGAYQQLTTVDIEHAIDIHGGEPTYDTELWMDLVQQLKRLPERDAIILSLYFEQDLNFSEIADILDIAVSTVTRSYQKTLAFLKKNLQIS